MRRTPRRWPAWRAWSSWGSWFAALPGLRGALNKMQLARGRAEQPGLAERRRRFRLGLSAEARARWALRLKGYRILAVRVRTPRGEIDLIAKRGNRLAFVEVKARATLEAAQHAITPRQQRRLVNAAELWLGNQLALQGCTLGFDAVFVTPRRWPRHAIDALQPL
ncbi:MAG: YraN family protein [Pseudomonadota bacterium]